MLILTVCFRLPEVLKVVISHMFSFKQFYYNRCYFYLQGGLTCNLRFYSITQRSSSAPGLLWEMPGSNPELTSIVHCTILYSTILYRTPLSFFSWGAEQSAWVFWLWGLRWSGRRWSSGRTTSGSSGSSSSSAPTTGSRYSATTQNNSFLIDL